MRYTGKPADCQLCLYLENQIHILNFPIVGHIDRDKPHIGFQRFIVKRAYNLGRPAVEPVDRKAPEKKKMSGAVWIQGLLPER